MAIPAERATRAAPRDASGSRTPLEQSGTPVTVIAPTDRFFDDLVLVRDDPIPANESWFGSRPYRNEPNTKEEGRGILRSRV